MSGLHYTKSGALDMRYSSSKAAVASGSYGGSSYSGSSASSYSSPSYSSSSSSSGLHYTKTGALDMRYNSSKAAVAAASAPAPRAATNSSTSSSGSGLHYTKTGNLDMRYSSSKAAVAAATQAPPPAPANLHLKKDGTPDMRYKSSRQYVEQLKNLSIHSAKSTGKDSATRYADVPRDVPVTQAGTPDLRTTRGKQWVQAQARDWHPTEDLPAWVPRLKDGSPDMTKAVARHFMGGSPALESVDRREDYYSNKRLADRLFEEAMLMQRLAPVEMVDEPQPLPSTTLLADTFTRIIDDADDTTSDMVVQSADAVLLDYAKDLTLDKDAEPLGHGSFGTVYLGKWQGTPVAIKKLHASQLTKKERKMFVRETLVLSLLGAHPNIVQLHGYTLNPVSLVMEYVPTGSLSYLLHYCEDPVKEAKITDGRVKLNILLGIAHGMTQLHACHVTHGDLKPQNILITAEFHAKIADFGLATFRAKAASSTSSHMLGSSRDDDAKDADFEGIAGGTAAYMAPELLGAATLANEKTDVYSFGVLMNELLQEEEPYQQNLRQFVGKGPFAAVMFAKEGHRPRLRDDKAPGMLKSIVQQCWHQSPSKRPSFETLAALLADCTIPHACQ